MVEIFFLLLAGHFVCDFGLQSEFMATYKSPRTPSPAQSRVWPWLMIGHATMHGAAVSLITGSLLLGVLETVCHTVIDTLKCNNAINFHFDQSLHIACKASWAIAATLMM